MRTNRVMGFTLVAMLAGMLMTDSAMAAKVFNQVLLADNSSNVILAYDLATKAYLNQFADASGLLAGATIRSIVTNDAGTEVYVAIADGNFNAAGARIYRYDVTLNGSTLTGTNRTLLYQHALGGWGERASMTIGPDRNSDGVQDIYFTVPLPGWNSETVYWVDGAAGGAATSYQNTATARNTHLEFKSNGSLGWARASVNNDQPRSWNSLLLAVYGETGTLKYDADSTNLLTGPGSPLTNNSDWRIMDIDFGVGDVLYYSSYYAKYDATYHRQLYSATYNSGTGYWTPTAFSGGGLGVDGSPTGLQPGVMSFLTFSIPEPGTACLALVGCVLGCMRRRRG